MAKTKEGDTIDRLGRRVMIGDTILYTRFGDEVMRVAKVTGFTPEFVRIEALQSNGHPLTSFFSWAWGNKIAKNTNIIILETATGEVYLKYPKH